MKTARELERPPSLLAWFPPFFVAVLCRVTQRITFCEKKSFLFFTQAESAQRKRNRNRTKPGLESQKRHMTYLLQHLALFNYN
jgi:hypothetical protein